MGGGIRVYLYGNFFVRPEMRVYLVHNNVEFSSGHSRSVRYGVSIGYTFGGTSRKHRRPDGKWSAVAEGVAP